MNNFKKTIIGLFLLTAATLNVNASFFEEVDKMTKTTIVQPNGDKYKVYKGSVDGFKYLRAPRGEVLIKDKDTGWYEHAMYVSVPHGAKLMSTGRKYKAKNTGYISRKQIKVNIWKMDIKEIARLQK